MDYIGGNVWVNVSVASSVLQHLALFIREHIDSPGCSMCHSNLAPQILVITLLGVAGVLAVPGPDTPYHDGGGQGSGGAHRGCRVEYEEVCQSSYETQCSNSYQDICLSVPETVCSPYKENQCFDVAEVDCQTREEKVCGLVEVPECQTKMEIIQEQQCSVEKVCSPVETVKCSPVTEDVCVTVPDLHCEDIPQEICQTKLEIGQHQQCFTVRYITTIVNC